MYYFSMIILKVYILHNLKSLKSSEDYTAGFELGSYTRETNGSSCIMKWSKLGLS